ncbi:hypothetical protein ACFVH6_31335 [Spirillospora sp. NPDC127200]
MARLNQIIAVEKGVKSRTQREPTDAYHGLQKPALPSGLSRTYRPRDEGGETLPPESTKVQLKAEDVLRDRVERLQAAVKFAREEADAAEVEDAKTGDAVFAYLS